VDISTTATYTSPVTVCIPYDPSIPNPQNLKLFHWQGDHWVNVTSGVDTANNRVCGQVASLSPFFIGDPSGGGAGDAAGVPVFPSVYIGIGAALGAGIVAYLIRKRLVHRT
jgi:hypothetical protein